jgi:hypothetical protein
VPLDWRWWTAAAAATCIRRQSAVSRSLSIAARVHRTAHCNSVSQCTQTFPLSSWGDGLTLIRRVLHWKQPFLDFVCDRRDPITTTCWLGMSMGYHG